MQKFLSVLLAALSPEPRSLPGIQRKSINVCKMKEWIFYVSNMKPSINSDCKKSQLLEITQTWNPRPFLGLSTIPTPQNYSIPRRPVLCTLTSCSSLPLFLLVPRVAVNVEKWPSTALADGADASLKENLGILSQSLSQIPRSPSSRELEFCIVFLQSPGILSCHWGLGGNRT